MTAKKKRIICWICGILAAALLVFVYMIFASFNGSILRKWMLKRQTKVYVKENYEDPNLSVTQVVYDFKMGMYLCRVESSVSEDTYFYVYRDRDGNLVDDYEFLVVQRENTRSRLCREMDDYADSWIKENYPYHTELVICDPTSTAYGDLEWSTLSLDMPFDIQTFPAACELTIWADSPEGEPTWEDMARRLRELMELTEDAFPCVEYYSLRLQGPYVQHGDGWGPADYSDPEVTVYSVPKDIIKNGDLEGYLEQIRLEQEEELRRIEQGIYEK